MSDECKNCDSTSMEMCLLIRHCPHWVERREPNSKDIPQPVVIVGSGASACPNCGADIHDMGMIERCPVCSQTIDWSSHTRRKKDSTGLSGGHLW